MTSDDCKRKARDQESRAAQLEEDARQLCMRLDTVTHDYTRLKVCSSFASLLLCSALMETLEMTKQEKGSTLGPRMQRPHTALSSQSSHCCCYLAELAFELCPHAHVQVQHDQLVADFRRDLRQVDEAIQTMAIRLQLPDARMPTGRR